ncbi:MAG: hypothetical protein PHS64_05145 [Candidatus Omnitrophica bacterium]|nr:hypothetical protein [Candidatus Omnitrophota bacterium]
MNKCIVCAVSVIVYGAWLVAAACLTGCRPAHYNELMLLKRWGQDRQGMEQYLDQKERFFAKLSADAAAGRLKRGMPEDTIISIYGAPVMCKKIASGRSRCLYRHPTEYFFTDKIYLTFDEEQNLDAWEFVAGRR